MVAKSRLAPGVGTRNRGGCDGEEDSPTLGVGRGVEEDDSDRLGAVVRAVAGGGGGVLSLLLWWRLKGDGDDRRGDFEGACGLVTIEASDTSSGNSSSP